MFRTNHARRSLVAGAAFAALSLGAVAAAPGALAAPGDSAGPTPSVGPSQTGGHTKLSVTGGTAVGLAGQPVDITEKITNTSSTEGENLFLNMGADAGDGMPEDGLSIWYQADNGAWKLLSMDYHSGSFQGMLPLTIDLAPSETRTIHLRFGLPMGEPHNGDSDGGATSVELTSSVGASDGSWALQARDIRTVKVQGLSADLSGVPKTAVRGGAPIEFNATVGNKTASDYINLNEVLRTNRYATVQVYRGGHWVTLTPVLVADSPDTAGYYLRTRDFSAAKGTSSTVRVRVSWEKNAPLGKTELGLSNIVNEGAPFQGSYIGADSAYVTVVRGSSSSPTASGSPTTSASPSPTATTSSSPSNSNSTSPSTTSPTPSATSSANTGELAETGNDGSSTLLLSLGGATLLLAGGAVVAYVRLRRGA